MMCVWKVENNWNELENQIKRDDILVVSSLKELSDDVGALQEKLKYCKEKGIQINLKGTCLSEEIYMDIIEVVDWELELRRIKLKNAQKRGIEEALKLHMEGKGNYGRPKVKIPDDFKEHVQYFKRNNLPLENYRKMTNLKKSTFYKYVKYVEVSL